MASMGFLGRSIISHCLPGAFGIEWGDFSKGLYLSRQRMWVAAKTGWNSPAMLAQGAARLHRAGTGLLTAGEFRVLCPANNNSQQ